MKSQLKKLGSLRESRPRRAHISRTASNTMNTTQLRSWIPFSGWRRIQMNPSKFISMIRLSNAIERNKKCSRNTQMCQKKTSLCKERMDNISLASFLAITLLWLGKCWSQEKIGQSKQTKTPFLASNGLLLCGSSILISFQ
jgi:hypothetical protein